MGAAHHALTTTLPYHAPLMSLPSTGPMAKLPARRTPYHPGLSAAAAIFRTELPTARWWSAVSSGAKSDEPYVETLFSVAFEHLSEPDVVEDWPDHVGKTDESLPPLTQHDALALLDAFLRSEVGELRAGVPMHPLHWDVLAARHAPLRERYGVLQHLVGAGLLGEPAKGEGRLHVESGLYWPLVVTDAAVERIRTARRAARWPRLYRAEQWLGDIEKAFPRLVRVLGLIATGGVLAKIAEWLIGRA